MSVNNEKKYDLKLTNLLASSINEIAIFILFRRKIKVKSKIIVKNPKKMIKLNHNVLSFNQEFKLVVKIMEGSIFKLWSLKSSSAISGGKSRR